LLNGFDAARKIRKSPAKTRVVLISREPQPRPLSEIVSAGVSAYIAMAASASELKEVLQAVCRGTVYVHPANRPQEDLTPSTAEPRNENLSLREREVLQLICEGKVCKEIAGVIGISTKTAESYRHRIVTKLGVTQTAGLVRYAVRTGMI